MWRAVSWPKRRRDVANSDRLLVLPLRLKIPRPIATFPVSPLITKSLMGILSRRHTHARPYLYVSGTERQVSPWLFLRVRQGEDGLQLTPAALVFSPPSPIGRREAADAVNEARLFMNTFSFVKASVKESKSNRESNEEGEIKQRGRRGGDIVVGEGEYGKGWKEIE